MALLSHQLNLLLLSLSFFTRLPVAGWVKYSDEAQQQSQRYFGLVGWCLGLLLVGVYWAMTHVVEPEVAVFIVMVASLLLTGVFHEDGLADMADGFGGGITIEQKLTIMKDSRLGTYGTVALIMALLGKYVLLLAQPDVIVALLVAYPLSRVVAISFIFDMRYVSDSGSSKSQSIVANEHSSLAVLLLSGVATFLLLPLTVVGWLILVLLVFRVIFKRLLLKHLNGFTGDCLGGGQQICELLIYLTFLVVIK
jgi:adenosylcobinamide-GDP ribazoletransferase